MQLQAMTEDELKGKQVNFDVIIVETVKFVKKCHYLQNSPTS